MPVTMRLLLSLAFVAPLAAQEVDFDFECGGTSLFEKHVQANETVTVGEVPAGLHRLAIHLWSDEDMDIQLVSGDTTVIHWKNGVIYHGDEQTSSFQGDTLLYSGYNGDRAGPGNEFIIFEGFTANDYKFLVHANEDGHIKARYGWIPLESCNINEKYYRNLDEMLNIDANDHGRRLQTKQSLHDSIKGHTEISYTAVWTALRTTDKNPANSGQVIGIYTRRGILSSYQDGSSSCGGNVEDCWNREHVYAKSRGDFGTTNGPGTDVHALRAEDRSVNTQRSNKNFGAGGSAVPDCSICLQTSSTWEPPAASKGAVARMLFYMAVRYTGGSDSHGVTLNVVGGNPADPAGLVGYIGDLALLKAWNNAYPVTTEERNRNNAVQSYYQGNRNPFIDNPALANSLF